MISFLIVGSGYQAGFYGKVAGTYPELFKAMFLCRSREKARLMEEKWGISATDSLEEALNFHPSFVVVAVKKDATTSVAREWIERGFLVFTETPVCAGLEDMEVLKKLIKEGARIATDEQYHRYPSLMAILRAVQEGRIGTPSSAYLTLAHDYHGFSLLRRMLLTGREEYQILADLHSSPVVKTSSREGDVTTGEMMGEERMSAIISFDSGKRAIYDFSGVQYHTHIRSRHLLRRGERGEISDMTLRYLDENHRPHVEKLAPFIPEKYQALVTPLIREKMEGFGEDLPMDSWEYEFAMASLLLDMGDFVAGGENPYPPEESMWDAFFWLRLQEAGRK